MPIMGRVCRLSMCNSTDIELFTVVSLYTVYYGYVMNTMLLHAIGGCIRCRPSPSLTPIGIL